MVLGHLADDEVVGVVAGDRGHDRGTVGAGLGKVRALAAVAVDDHRAQLVADTLRSSRVLLHEHDLVAFGQQLLGQVEADAASTYDDHEHVSGPRWWRRADAGVGSPVAMSVAGSAAGGVCGSVATVTSVAPGTAGLPM